MGDNVYKINSIVVGKNEFYETLEKYCKQEKLDYSEALRRLGTKNKWYHKKVGFYIQQAVTGNKYSPKSKRERER